MACVVNVTDGKTMNNQKPKMFIVRKYVMARSVQEALKLERSAPIHEVFIDDEWSKGNRTELASAIGYKIDRNDE